MTNKKAVFVSYSWAVEDETNIVDEIEALCPARDIDLIRDRNALKHGDLIDDFMQRLSGGEHIITVFSKPYFQSKWCMYELVEIWKSRKFQQRTHPIIADDCDLQSAAYRMDTVQYWVEEHQKIAKLLKGRNPELHIEEYKKLNLLRDISQVASEIMNFAAGRVTTQLPKLRDQQYTQFLDQISPVKTEDAGSGCFDDDDFLNDVKKHLASDLQKSDAFLRHIKNVCEADFLQDSLENYLVDQCLAGEFVETIQNIQSAFVDAFDEIGEQDIAAVKKLYQAAEGIVSKLVLFNVKKEWMQQYRQACSQHSHHEHVLPDMTFGSVEVVMSREARTLPEFSFTPHDLSLQAGQGVRLESGFRENNIIEDVITRLYRQVHQQEFGRQPDKERAIDILQKTIRQRKQHKNLKLRKNYFLVLSDLADSPLADRDVQEKIKSLLPDLAFITLKANQQEETFIVEDTELMVAISEFFTTLEYYKPNEQHLSPN